VALSLETARLHRAEVDRERMAAELRVAREIQQDLLPKTLPALPGWEMHGTNVPSLEVGGDYYDVLALPDGRAGIAIADVSGKGTPAALLMAHAQATLRSLAPGIADTAALIGRMNRLISRSVATGRFITFCYGVLDPAAGTFRYCNAGHNYPYALRPGGALEALKAGGGPGLGMVDAWDYEEVVLDVGDAAALFFYTDGVTEAASAGGDLYGEKRLQDVLRASEGPASARVSAVVRSVDAFAAGAPQADDITVLAAVRQP
jgi:sigma-B regulation protein RsbU (phosphoserine phosphatase)